MTSALYHAAAAEFNQSKRHRIVGGISGPGREAGFSPPKCFFQAFVPTESVITHLYTTLRHHP